MRKLLAVIILMMLVPVGASSLTGCSGGDEVLENDPKVSEAKRIEYAATMKEQQAKNRPTKKGR